MAVSKRLKSMDLISLENVKNERDFILITKSQTKVQEVLREIFKNSRIEMLGVISRYVER